MLISHGLYNVKLAECLEFIKILYLQDNRFKKICDDYCSSKTNAQVYKRKFEKHLLHTIEFEILSRELEEEILIYLIRNS